MTRMPANESCAVSLSSFVRCLTSLDDADGLASADEEGVAQFCVKPPYLLAPTKYIRTCTCTCTIHLELSVHFCVHKCT